LSNSTQRAFGGTIKRSRPARWQAVAVWAMWVGSVVFVAISLVTVRSGGDLLGAVGQDSVAIPFATVGAILASRLPGNVIGWLLAAGGFCFAVGSGVMGLGVDGLSAHPGSVPGAIWFAWLSEWIWAPALGSVVGLALVYPSGRLLSPRWRPVALAALLVIAILSVGTAIGPWTDGMFPAQNPLAINGGMLPPPLAALPVLGSLLGLIALAVPLLAVGSLALHYRRAAGIERAQLKWFAVVVAISVPAFLVSTFLYTASGVAGVVANVAGTVAYLGFALLPVAIGIAILRYRLYEIDRISRTVSYIAVTAVLVAVFTAVNLALEAALTSMTQASTLAVAASTLAVFAFFQPLRRRVQALVDHRFNRDRYEADRIVAAFAERLRDEVDPNRIRLELEGALAQTVAPRSVYLWLRGERETVR
jgi:hypothetical protein